MQFSKKVKAYESFITFNSSGYAYVFTDFFSMRSISQYIPSTLLRLELPNGNTTLVSLFSKVIKLTQ